MKASRFGRVGVLAGGPSNEREISLRSGKAVHNALIREGIDSIFIDVRDDIMDIIKNRAMDVAFIALHGRFGEDGTLQSILEEAGIPYTGSGKIASRLAIDKIASKKLFIEKAIPVPRYIAFEKDELSFGSRRLEDAFFLGLPIVVKPQLEGSSIGLSIVRQKSDLTDAVKKAFEYGERAIIEEYIDGRELTVGILDDEPLPVIEIVARERVYDYKAKYTDPETKYLCPAPIDTAIFEKAKEFGRRSHKALGCISFSRIDMMMDAEGDLFVLEVNTIPGMTERSLLPKAAQAIGLNFNQLCIKLIENVFKIGKA